jgi:ribonuclease BN (tRNA processing enzyme)
MTVKLTFAGTGDAFGSGGRFNTCIIVDAPGIRFAIDFGASSLIALNALGIPHNSIDLVLLTHIHGDHCAGVPQMIMDAMLGAKRQSPLVVAGPVETEARLSLIREALFPGSAGMQPKFDLTIRELETLKRQEICGLSVTTYPAIHTPQTNPTSMRIEVAGKVIAYTGDTAWTEHIPTLADGADVFISECYFHQKAVPFHMNYPDIDQHRAVIKAKRIVLTHMGPEMLARINDVPEVCAYDGLELVI